jgi:3-methyladenine DNA glycosylase AlkC
LSISGLKDRARCIGLTLAQFLPNDLEQLTEVLIESWGPILEKTENNGLSPFYYLPYTSILTEILIESWECGIRANFEITQRFTAEFSLRPYLMRYEGKTLTALEQWTKHQNPHIRRAASESTRPRLPWAQQLPNFRKDPRGVLQLILPLIADESLYVRRSVANNLADIAKDHSDLIFDLLMQLIRESIQKTSEEKKRITWVIRHAIRYFLKKKNIRALEVQDFNQLSLRQNEASCELAPSLPKHKK